MPLTADALSHRFARLVAPQGSAFGLEFLKDGRTLATVWGWGAGRPSPSTQQPPGCAGRTRC